MMRQVAERRRKVLGDEHPDALAAQGEFAALLARRDRSVARAEALALQRDLVSVCEAKLGPYHVDTLAARAALARSLVRVGGEARAAEALHLETVARFDAVAAGEAGLQAGTRRPPHRKLHVLTRE